MAQWIGYVGTPWNINTPRPWDHGVYDLEHPERWELTKRREERFDQEFAVLTRYSDIRRVLLCTLAFIGHTIPSEIDRRAAVAHHAWPEGGSEPITQAELLAMVREADTAPVTSPIGAPTPPPPNPIGSALARRLECYHPVPLEELRPRRPEPLASDVTSAMQTVPVALSESRFGSPSAHLGLSACEHALEFPAWLAFAQERRLGRAAAEWAIYRLVEAGRLCVVWPETDRLAPITNEHAKERAERYRARPETVTDWDLFEHRRILQIRSTPALWEWWRGGATTASEPGSKEDKGNSDASGAGLPLPIQTGNGSNGAGARGGEMPNWSELGDAKRAILKVLASATEAMQNPAVASKAGYTSGTLRHHYGELQEWKLVESVKDGYTITPLGRAMIPTPKV